MYFFSYRFISVFILSGLIFGCSTPERLIPQEELENRFDDYTLNYKQELDIAEKKSMNRITNEYLSSENQVFDVLVLSGGGEYGAFGAGFLQGWGTVDDLNMSRPHFDSVSGVSTGALIAPFAFVGTEESYAEIVNLYSNPQKNFIVPQSILSFLSGSDAFYDASVLHQRIADGITSELVSELNAGSVENRVLLVGATNIDYGLMRVWDLADIAKNLTFESAKYSIVEKLIASSALPSAFPPVEIDELLYVDGGASMQVVSGISDRSWLYDSKVEGLRFVTEDKPVKIRIWIIVNNKLMLEPLVTQRSWADIGVRSLSSIMRGATLQTLQDIDTFSQMINQHELFDVEMRYVAIPQSFDIPDTEDMFDKAKMEKLVELGRKMGSNTNSWKTEALPPGAAFE